MKEEQRTRENIRRRRVKQYMKKRVVNENTTKQVGVLGEGWWQGVTN